jgi:predicted DNA-binding transcriptional regulator YafY
MDDSLKKINRIVAILTHLQAGKNVTAQALSDRFNVSLRTIYRDMRTIEEAGVPVIGEAGLGYSIMSGYRLAPVMFTREEAGSFIAAEKLMQHLTDETLGKHYESAMYKIKAVMRATDKERLEALEQSIEVRPREEMFNDNVPHALATILEAIADRTQIILTYQAQYQEPSVRHIEPVGIFHESGFWYFTGYCILRQAYRQFRLDRIIMLSGTDKAFTKAHPSLQEVRSSDHSLPITKVRILASKNIAQYMGVSKYNYGFVKEEESGDKVIMHFETRYLEYGFDRWLMMYADECEILEPSLLKERVSTLLHKIQQKHSS